MYRNMLIFLDQYLDMLIFRLMEHSSLMFLLDSLLEYLLR